MSDIEEGYGRLEGECPYCRDDLDCLGDCRKPEPCEHGIDPDEKRCLDCRPIGHVVNPRHVAIDRDDPSDPLPLVAPHPFTREERDQAVQWLDELYTDGHCERWEATCRQLEAERDAALKWARRWKRLAKVLRERCAVLGRWE